MDISCKCGHKLENIIDNNRYPQCSKCGQIYDETGEEVEMQTPYTLGDLADPIFVKNGKILAPRIINYRGNIFDPGLEVY